MVIPRGARERDRMLGILRQNKGFRDPERWIEYACRHSFQDVQATELTTCPDCDEATSSPIGQYVYYSTLLTLRSCQRCGLVYADTRIDPAVIRQHFDAAYKDERYFLRRRRIFSHIAQLVDRHAPRGSAVLDIGGAKGHLLAAVRSRRPDLTLVLNDISREACDWAASAYGFETVCGSVPELEHLGRRFDVVVMSDVLYYEAELAQLWRLLPWLVNDGGTVVIRVPNKLWLIRLSSSLARIRQSAQAREMSDRIAFFNPEHLYVFSAGYLERRLKESGFADTAVMPSPLLARTPTAPLTVGYHALARLVHTLGAGRLVITPSLVVVSRKARPE